MRDDVYSFEKSVSVKFLADLAGGGSSNGENQGNGDASVEASHRD